MHGKINVELLTMKIIEILDDYINNTDNCADDSNYTTNNYDNNEMNGVSYHNGNDKKI